MKFFATPVSAFSNFHIINPFNDVIKITAKFDTQSTEWTLFLCYKNAFLMAATIPANCGMLVSYEIIPCLSASVFERGSGIFARENRFSRILRVV